MPVKIEGPPNETPDLEGLVDDDILQRFEGARVFWGDILTAQLVKTNRAILQNLVEMVEQGDILRNGH